MAEDDGSGRNHERPVEPWRHGASSSAFLKRLRREAEAVRAHARSEDGRVVEARGEALFDETMAEIEAREERGRTLRGSVVP